MKLLEETTESEFNSFKSGLLRVFLHVLLLLCSPIICKLLSLIQEFIIKKRISKLLSIWRQPKWTQSRFCTLERIMIMLHIWNHSIHIFIIGFRMNMLPFSKLFNLL